MKPICPFFLIALTACSPGVMDRAQTGVVLQAQAVGGQLAYGAPVLAAAKRAFFGETGGTDGGSGGGSTLLTPQDPVDLQGFPPSVTALALTRIDDLGGGVALHSAAMMGFHHLHGSLPNGLGVLTDPLQIDIWAQSLGLQMTLNQTRALPGNLHVTYGAGAGITRLSAATHLQSALLDVRGRSVQTLPYAVAEGRISGPTGPAVLGSLWVFSSGAKEVRLGIEQAF